MVLSLDRPTLMRVADGLAIATAASLPWSTSAVSIGMVLWLIVVIPTLDWPSLRRELLTPAGGLPVLLVLLGAAGVLWADVSLHERWKGLDSFLKLAVIPLLFIHFRHSERGRWVFAAYVISCALLLLASYVLIVCPSFPLHLSAEWGVPVRNASSQSGAFVTCIFGLAFLAREAVHARQWARVAALLAVILAMFANIFFVATGRTALLVSMVLVVVFAITQLSRRGMVVVFAAALVVGVAGWFGSSYLRMQVTNIWTQFKSYEISDARNSSGERIEFAKKSVEFIQDAPVFGHGTGSIADLFAKATAGKTGASGSMTTNPHNQTFAVAIQLGLVGAAVLWAMWIAHLLLFRAPGFAEWIGLLIVAQNVVGSLFNSHLFDFLQGWMYVLGVGIAGGMVLKRRAGKAS